MSKLDELGGLEAANEAVAYLCETHKLPHKAKIMLALIEHIESLTSELDSLKMCLQHERDRLVGANDWATGKETELQAAQKRVEELERQINSYKKELTDARDFAKEKSMQLHAARELVKFHFARIESRVKWKFLLDDDESAWFDKARDFLKMLDSPAQQSTPPAT